MFSAAIKSGAAASTPVDAQFNYVTMLLHGDGTNGANNGGVNTSGVTPFNTDASTNAFPVTINGDTKPNNFNPYQAGYYGNYFPSGSMLSTAYSSAFDFGTGDFTMEAWVNLDSLPAPQTIFSCVDAGATVGYSLLILANGFVEVDVVAAQSFICNSNPVQVRTWTHVAFTKSSGTYRAFVNGQLCTTSANTLGTTINSTSQGMCVARSVASGYNFPLAGYISNARIVKGTALYTSSFTPSTTPLTSVSGTSLLTCQSNRFIDNSASPFTLSLTGNPSISYNQPFTVPSTYSTYGAGYFDGTGDYLTAPSNAVFGFGTGDFTIEGWLYWISGAGENTFFCVDVTGGANIFLDSSGNWGIGTRGIVVNNSFGTMPIKNTWNHLAVSRSGSTIRAFINGAQVYSGSNSINYATGSPSIAAIATASGNIISGYITDLRVVKGTAVYTAAFTPPTAPLTAITNTSLLTLQTNGPVNDSGFVDSSPNNFAITRNGNTTQGSFSPYGSNWSNYFGGSSYIYTAASTAFQFGTSDFTMECWINMAAGATLLSYWASFFSVCTDGTTGGNGVTLYITDGASGSSVAGEIAVNVGSATRIYGGQDIRGLGWVHVAVTRSGTTVRLFVNGVQKSSATNSLDINASSYGGSVGVSYVSASNYFVGYVSNARAVKGFAVYTSNFTPSTTPLTAVSGTSLLTCQSNRFIDNSTANSGSGFAITVSGTPSVQRFNPFGASTAYSTATIGGSGYFDGSGDYLNVANSNSFDTNTTYTMECWFYVTSSSDSILYNKGGGGGSPGTYWNTTNGHQNLLFVGSGSLSYQWNNGTSAASPTNISTTAFTLNAWNHFAVSYDGATTRCWVNGASMGTSTAASVVPTTRNLVYVGQNTAGGGYAPTGYISNLRFVQGSNVYSTASSTITVPTAPLTAVTNTSLLLSMTNAGIYDNAMMNNLETVGNAQVSSSVKKYGTGSIWCNGQGNEVICTTPTAANLSFGTGDFTIECWMNTGSTSGQNMLWSFNWATGSGGWALFPESAGYKGLVFGDGYGSSIKATWDWSTNTWYHVAVCRSGTSLRLFVDGTQIGSTFTNSNSINALGNYVKIGSNSETNTVGYTGYIDDLRITKGYARYTATFTTPTKAFPNIGPVSS